MADAAEKVAVDIIARTDGFTTKVRQSAASFGSDMDRIRTAAGRAETAVESSMNKTAQSMNRAAQQSRLLGYQISDIGTQLAAGTSPFLVLAQQGPQVANALEGARGGLGRFASFLSGPWGAALLAATTILGGFILKNRESGESVDDLVKKLQEKARQEGLNKQATEAYTRTLQGQIDAQRDLTEELDRQLKSQRELNRETLRAAQTNADKLKKDAADLRRDLAEARKDAKSAKDFLLNPPLGAAPEAMVVFAQQAAAAEQKVADLQKKLNEASAAAREAQSNIRKANIPILDDQVAAGLDSLTAATQNYTDALTKLRLEYEAGTKSEQQYRREKAKLEKDLRKAEEAARTARSGNSGDLASFIRPVEGGAVSGRFGENRGNRNHAGIDFAVPVGTNVKSAQAGTVITAGTLPGFGNVVIVDHGRGTTTRYAHLSQILAKKGDTVSQGQVIGLSGGAPGAQGSGNSRGAHLHYEVRQGGKSVDPTKGVYAADAAAAQTKAVEDLARQAEQEAERKRQVAGEEASLDTAILRRKQDLAASAEAETALELEAIKVAQEQYEADLAHLVATGKVHEAEAEVLRKKNAVIADLDRQLVQRREEQRIRDQNLRIAEGLIDNNLDLLRSEEGLATSQKERRRIALAILDAEYEKLRLTLENQLKQAEINGASDEELKIMRQRLENLKQTKANATESTMKDTASPLEAYINGIEETAGALDEAFEEIAVGSLQSLVDGLGQAAAGFTSLGDVARGILAEITASLVKLAAQQLILKLLGETIGGSVEKTADGAKSAGQAAAAGASAATASTVAQAATVAAAWAPAAAAASLATLGSNAGPAIGALVATHAVSLALAAAGSALGGAAKLAGGGRVTGPGTATSDSVPALLSNGEFVIRKKAVDGVGFRALEEMNRTGRLPVALADGGVVARAVQPSNASAAPRGGSAMTSLSPEAVRELKGIVGDAMSAMPPVNLYPTLDPGAAMERMLSDPRAQRAMFEFVGQNSGKFNSQLRR